MPLISDKQRAANRSNATKSTGPKTSGGKHRSRTNSTTHGLTSSARTIYQPVRNEDANDFSELLTGLVESWSPVGDRELLAVHMMAAAYKRIQRAEAWEAAYFDGAMEAMQLRAEKPRRTAGTHDNLGCGIALGKPEHQLTWERLDRYRRAAWADYNRAVEQLRRLQHDRLMQPTRQLRACKHTAELTATTAVLPATPVNAAIWASFRRAPRNLNLRAAMRARKPSPGAQTSPTQEANRTR
jgi:hypothetical protein